MQAHLARHQVELSEFKTAVLRQIGLHHEDEAAGPRTLRWNPCASDALMFSASQELCDYLASLTGRKLQWKDPRKSEMLFESSWNFTEGSMSSKSFEFFISYYREEAGPHARLLRAIFEKHLGGKRVFLECLFWAELPHLC